MFAININIMKKYQLVENLKIYRNLLNIKRGNPLYRVSGLNKSQLQFKLNELIRRHITFDSEFTIGEDTSHWIVRDFIIDNPNLRGDINIIYTVKGVEAINLNYNIPNTNSGIRRFFDVKYIDWIADSENSIFSQNSRFPQKIYFYTSTNTSIIEYEQIFTDGDIQKSNCFIYPIRQHINKKIKKIEYELDKLVKKTKGYRNKQKLLSNEKKRSKTLEKYESIYSNTEGLTYDNIQDLMNEVQGKVIIENPFNILLDKKIYKIISSYKKPRFTIKYINTRINHLDVLFSEYNHNIVVNEELINKKAELDKPLYISKKLNSNLLNIIFDFAGSNLYINYIYTKNSKGINKIIYNHNVYSLENDFYETIKEFEKKQGLDKLKLNYYRNPALCEYIESGIKSNMTIDFKHITKYRNNIDLLNHYDQEKAYTQFHKNPYYQGFYYPTDWRDLKSVNIEFAFENTGLYTIYDIIVPSNAPKVILHLDLFRNYFKYESSELKFYYDLGYRFKLLNGCYGVKAFDFTFTDEMYKKEKKVSYYAKWCGLIETKRKYKKIFMKTSLSFASVMNFELGEKNYELKFFKNKELMINIPKDNIKYAPHITGSIKTYQRIFMLLQLIELDYDKIVRVCVDGVYVEKGKHKLLDTFTNDKEIRLGNDTCKSYCSNMYPDNYDYLLKEIKPELYIRNDLPKFRKHYKKEMCKGAGGCGKTHYNICDNGLVNKLYIAPSYKLTRSKIKEYNNYNIKCMVLAKLLINELTYTPHTIIFDEVSMMTKETKKQLFNLYPYTKLIFCGDIECQLEPIEKLEQMNYNGFDNIREFTTNYRVKDQKLLRLLNEMRKDIINDKFVLLKYLRALIKMGRSIKREHVKNIYDIQDYILCSSHKYIEQWNKILDDKFEKTKYRITKSSIEYSNGDVIISDLMPSNSKISYAFTSHSIQGETIRNEKVFIDIRYLFSKKMFYTMCSRVTEIKQLYIIV